ncbi:MAG: S1C family serine protease [Chthoniobacter sp.]|nr:S1C family serine protease [Chthoniobacter sp.]
MSRLRPSISRRGPLVLAACGTLLGSATLFAADDDPGKVLAAFQQQAQAVFEKCGSAVVRIEASDAHGRLAGTGFFIDPNGTLYTSYSVGGESQNITVEFRGERQVATRLVSDIRSGIALLKIEAETPFLTVGHTRDLAIASPVIALGYPQALPLTPAFGTVAGFDGQYGGRFFATTHLRVNVPVQRGEGGAPLLNTKGEVVGILISMLDAGSASFVLPIEAAEKVRMDFTRFREVRPGWIGMHVKAADAAAGGSTARIEEVVGDGPAQKAGLQAGDILLQVGARKITVPEDVLDASFFLTAEDATSVRVVRDGRVVEMQIQPTDPPNADRVALPASDPSPLRLQGLRVNN